MSSEQNDSAQQDVSSRETDKDARTMGMLAHLSGILFGFVGPLVVWLVKKDSSRFVEDQGKEALNFQLVILILYVVVSLVTCGFGFPVVYLAQVVFSIIAGLKANDGVYYRYPYTFRFLK